MAKDTKKEVSKKTKTAIKPLGDRIVVREDTAHSEKETASGIIIPVNVREDKSGSRRGVVTAVGSGRFEDGTLVPLSVKVGDSVLFQWGDKVVVDGEEFYIVKESEVLAVIG